MPKDMPGSIYKFDQNLPRLLDKSLCEHTDLQILLPSGIQSTVFIDHALYAMYLRF